MSLGSRHRLTGIVKDSARGFVLRVDDGGVWALDHDRKLGNWLGQRVVVEGTRIGFDLLAVDYIGPAHAP